MKTKYEIIEVDHVEVTVDLSLLTKSGDMFFNATEIANRYEKRVADFWKISQNREYLDVLITLSEGNKKDFTFSKKGKYRELLS